MIETLQRRLDDSRIPYDECGADSDVHFFAFPYRRLMRLKKPRAMLVQLRDGSFASATWCPKSKHFKSASGKIRLAAAWRVFELIDPFGMHAVEEVKAMRREAACAGEL